MNELNKIELGIEIVSAMKASCYGFDIELGRLMALENTEHDNIEGMDYEECDNDEKELCHCIAKIEKESLHKQALFVADIALAKMRELNVCQ